MHWGAPPRVVMGEHLGAFVLLRFLSETDRLPASLPVADPGGPELILVIPPVQ
ncbi:MAG: hypothetical protein RLZ55_29 [Actinomycetota bacterium]